MLEGMKIVDRKVEAILKQTNVPKDKEGLLSFQGMVNHLKCFSVQLMKLSKPLQEEDVEWTWDSTHQDASDTIKEELSVRLHC